MKLWIDAQISPTIAHWLSHEWLSNHFKIEVQAVRDLGLLAASDEEIFQAARLANATVVSKDSDFVRLVEKNGIPPQLLWITCGNTSNSSLRQIFSATLENALKLLQEGDEIVEICEAHT